MEHISLTFLIVLLVSLIAISGFFSAAEIGMMALNRYRLNHLIQKKHRFALLVGKLLERPDRLLSVILIGNTFANIVASAVATMIASHLFGDMGVAITTVLLTFVVLIISEVAPKTFATSYQQPVAFFSVIPLMILLKLLYPVVWLVNTVANNLLKLMRIKLRSGQSGESLSSDELRTVLYEAGGLIQPENREMLISILDLEQVTVNDIMVPKHEIAGIDLEDEWTAITQQLKSAQHTRLPVYTGHLENLLGILHVRSAISLALDEKATKDDLVKLLQPIFYIPEHTPLHRLLLNFRQEKTRLGFVVDEYGDIEGLATLEDILEEIVGEFTTNIAEQTDLVIPQEDNSYLVDGSALIRDLNYEYHWELPTDGPKTLSGLIIEYLQFIPQESICVMIDGYPIEVIKVKDNLIKTAKIFPRIQMMNEEE